MLELVEAHPGLNVPQQALRHHVVISGTGRAGTTFLVKLLTGLGFDTGFGPDYMPILKNCRAGLERDLRDPHAPHVVKDPWICDYIDQVIADPRIVIDFAIVPTRCLTAAAESRRHVSRTSDQAQYDGPQSIPGGLWGTSLPEEQEAFLLRKLYRLLLGLSRSGAQIILLHYPSLVKDAQFLMKKLEPLLALRSISPGEFHEAFKKVVDLSLVHQFTDDDL